LAAVSAKNNTMVNIGLEQFKAGLQLAEVARLTKDLAQAKKITKQAFQLINSGSKSIMELPDDWCGTGPHPWPWPIPRPNWREIETQLSQAEVLGHLATIQKNIILEDVKSNINVAIKDIATQIAR
jgi:hypothetical protein